jgi:hypothetical protein
MKLHTLLSIILLNCFFVCLADTPTSGQAITSSQAGVGMQDASPAKAEKDSSAGDLNAFFKQQMNDAVKRLATLKSVFVKISQYLQDVTYDEDAQIELLTKDPVDPSKKIGLIINFGDSGHGALSGFDGFTVDLVIEAVPDFLLNAFSGALKDALAPLFKGRSFSDVKTKVRVLKSSAPLEFIFKMILLVNDFARKEADDLRIDLRHFNVEMMLLMFRLAQTPGIKDIADVFNQIPEPLKNMVEQVKIKTKTARQYITSLWKNYLSMANYDLKKIDNEWTALKASLGAGSVDALNKWAAGEPLDAALFDKLWDEVLSKQKPVWGAKDVTMILEALSAVGLRAVVEYTKAKDKFSLSAAGKEALAALEEDEDTAAFNKKLPQFKDLKKALLIRFMIIASKVDGFMALQNKILERVRPVIDELLTQFGIQLDSIFPREKAKTQEELEAEALQSELEAELAREAMFGEDLEEFEYVDADAVAEDETDVAELDEIGDDADSSDELVTEENGDVASESESSDDLDTEAAVEEF